MATHQGITTDEAWEMVPQNEESFIWQYVNYGIEHGDSPLAFHVGIAYSLLASAVPNALRTKDFSGGRMPANLYCLLTGPTGSGHKTTALKRGSSLFRDAGFTARYKSSIGSTEAMEDDLMIQKGHISLWLAEFGNFLKEALDGHKTGAKAWLTEQFDCDTIDKTTRGKGRVYCPDPRLCLIGAVNHDYLETHTRKEDWDAGLFSRVFMMHSRDTRKDPDVLITDTERSDWLMSRLHETGKLAVARGGGLTYHAEQRWREFLAQVESQKKQLNTTRAAAANARAATMALKISLLLTADLDQGACVQELDWEIPEECIEMGITAAKFHWRESLYLANLVSSTEEGRLLRVIMAACRRYTELHHGNTMVPYSWLLREGLNNDYLVSDVKHYIETLTVSGQAALKSATSRTGEKEVHIKLVGDVADEGSMSPWLEDVMGRFKRDVL